MEPITIEIQKMWNEYFPVPDFEVQRCRLLRIPLLVQLKNKNGYVEKQIMIPPDRVEEGKKTGLTRSIGSWRYGTDQQYEVVLFNPADFSIKSKVGQPNL